MERHCEFVPTNQDSIGVLRSREQIYKTLGTSLVFGAMWDVCVPMEVKGIGDVRQGGRGQLAVDYDSLQSIVITFSYSLAKGLFKILVGWFIKLIVQTCKLCINLRGIFVRM